MKGAGTDAQVFLQIYGERGKSDEIKLENNSDSFEQGQLDKFMVSSGLSAKLEPLQLRPLSVSHSDVHCYLGLLQIEMPDMGKLTKVRIWHEKRHPFAGWHLARVRPRCCVCLIC